MLTTSKKKYSCYVRFILALLNPQALPRLGGKTFYFAVPFLTCCEFIKVGNIMFTCQISIPSNAGKSTNF